VSSTKPLLEKVINVFLASHRHVYEATSVGFSATKFKPLLHRKTEMLQVRRWDGLPRQSQTRRKFKNIDGN
jgi:hypothetical protein